MCRLFVILVTILHAALALAAAFVATHMKDPHLLPVRNFELPGLLGLAICGLVLTCWKLYGNRLLRNLFLSAWGLVLISSAWSGLRFQQQIRAIQSASGEDAQRLTVLGKHLVVGYDKPEDVRELVRRGYVAGLFVTRRNSEGKNLAQLREEIASFQALRREAKLPALLIASDQEGGLVSRLSPPLPKQMPIRTLDAPGLSPDETARHAFEYGSMQGKALANVGVNVNFSPVLDIRPEGERDKLDLQTRLDLRAISADPARISHIALAYSQGLLSQGVIPTAKHFPGLGESTGDTHYFSAHLDVPVTTLAHRDWLPFHTLLENTPALLMVSHVILDPVDSQYPVSVSPRVLHDIVRGQWHYDGIVITDDMTMSAVYNRGLCDSSERAMNAGNDLLLVSYDWEKIYPVMGCLLRAEKAGKLTALSASDARLAKAPWLAPGSPGRP